MFRSLHMKLVLIMVLLIVSLMTVVGAFLVNSVVSFYLQGFYDSMVRAFAYDGSLMEGLQTPSSENEGPENAADWIKKVLDSYTGQLGVDGQNRNYYLVDARTQTYLKGSDDLQTLPKNYTPNLLTALSSGEPGFASDVTATYMDVAVPFTRNGIPYVVQVYDTREAAQNLNSQLIELIVRALGFGLIISVLLSFLLSKTMITPIERLTVGAERVAEGDFTHKLTVASRDEIGVLTGTFNAMARQLQDTIQEVENERNKLDTLFIHMTDGVVAFARNGLVIHANPAACKMLGRTIAPGGEESYGSLFGDIAPLYQVLEIEQPNYMEGTRVLKDRSLGLLLAPFSGEAQGGVMVVIHDITEQQRTETLRREFVANVSHELRTPLTNIRSYAETLVDSAGAISPETEKNFLGVILNESDRMTHIVQDLLTLSRLDSGHGELNLTRFPFGAAVQSVYDAVHMEAQRHGHTIHLSMAPELPQIMGDRERILQVMMNVVSNAIKYTPDNGQIDISTGWRRDKVWMEVSDNGIGIPAEDRPRIFERFYRVDKARSRESGGTGLGLSIAKEIVDRHAGTLSLVDRAGPGTTVRMELLVEGPSHDPA